MWLLMKIPMREAGIARAIEGEFANTGVQLRNFYMDTKNHPAEAEKQAAALKAKSID